MDKIKKKIIKNPKGDIKKILLPKKNDKIEEVYFNFILKNKIKGWIYHKKMTSRFIVCKGKIQFVFFNDQKKKFESINLSEYDDFFISIKAKTWFSFKGLSNNNSFINLASIKNDKSEYIKKDINYFKFWK